MVHADLRAFVGVGSHHRWSRQRTSSGGLMAGSFWTSDAGPWALAWAPLKAPSRTSTALRSTALRSTAL